MTAPKKTSAIFSLMLAFAMAVVAAGLAYREGHRKGVIDGFGWGVCTLAVALNTDTPAVTAIDKCGDAKKAAANTGI